MSRLASLCFWILTPVHDGTQRYQPRGHIIWVSGSSSSRAARAGGRGVDHLPTSSRLEQPSSLSPREREPQRHPLTRLIMFNRMCVRQCWLPAFVLWTCSYCPEPSFSHSYNHTAQLTPSASAVRTLTRSCSGQSKLTALFVTDVPPMTSKICFYCNQPISNVRWPSHRAVSQGKLQCDCSQVTLVVIAAHNAQH